jgi:DNA-directed RNA polymerase I, II, and III subunit RPABC2
MNNRMKKTKKVVEESSNSEQSDNASDNSSILDDDVDNYEDEEEDIEDYEDEYLENNPLENELQKENDDDIECFYDINNNDETNNENNDVPNEDRITAPYLTKYERVRVLGTRAKQISLGAKILIKDIDLKNKSPIEIAKIELSYGVIPFKIRRPLPNGKIEEWKISELVKVQKN